MGMYTELVFASEIKRDVKVTEVLKYLANPSAMMEEPDKYSEMEHPFFKTDRWDMILCGGSESFPAISCNYAKDDEVFDTFNLTFRSNIKNYDEEYEKFLNWLEPYIITENILLGYIRYEEDDFPTLIYKLKGKLVFIKMECNIDIWEE